MNLLKTCNEIIQNFLTNTKKHGNFYVQKTRKKLNRKMFIVSQNTKDELNNPNEEKKKKRRY